MPTSIELSIYRTLAYFAYFKYPLTTFEIWKWLLEPGEPTSLAQIFRTVESSAWLKLKLRYFQGFYGLADIEAWVQDRHLRFLDASRKYHKVFKLMKLYGRLPGVEGVGVCNSLAWHHTNQSSDIDLFVVARPGYLWSVRLLTTLPVLLARQRPGESRSDPVCLSFFCTSEALAMEKLKVGVADPYLAYWSYSLVPVYDRANWSETFAQTNQWLKQVLPNAYGVRRAWRFRLSSRWRLPWPAMFEGWVKRLQLSRFPKRIRELMNKDTRVVVTDEILKFHDDDGREQILCSLQERMNRL